MYIKEVWVKDAQLSAFRRFLLPTSNIQHPAPNTHYTHYLAHQLIVSTKITQRNWRWFKMNHTRANGTLYSYRYTVN